MDEETRERDEGPDLPEAEADGEPARCECHPSLDAAGRCPRCDEPRCALCFEDGRDGLCRDCTPADATAVGRIRPSLRIVRLDLDEGPSPWAIAAMVLGKVAGTTMVLLGLVFLSAHEGGPWGGSDWALFLKTGNPVAIGGICACLAVAWVLLRARPLVPQRKNEPSQSPKVSK